MKKSTEFLVGESVQVSGVAFTKTRVAVPEPQAMEHIEQWQDEAGRVYEPGLGFVLGVAAPYFNPE